MTKYCKDMCIVCFAPKRYDSQWLYAPAEENALEINVSEVGLIYQDLIQVSLSCKEAGPQYVCNYCKTQLNTFHKFKLKALDAFRKVSEENYDMPNEHTISTENLVKVEEITVFDVSTKQTEKFEIQYFDDEEDESADIIEIEESKTFVDDVTCVSINGSNIDHTSTSSSSKSNTTCAQVICQLCTKRFESNEAFHLHWKEHEKTKSFGDDAACVSINGSNIDHTSTSSSSKSNTTCAQIICQLCTKMFESNEAFNLHWKEHEEVPQYRMLNSRVAILELFKAGSRQCEIVRLLGIPKQTVSDTIKRFRQRGYIDDRPLRTRKRKSYVMSQ